MDTKRGKYYFWLKTGFILLILSCAYCGGLSAQTGMRYAFVNLEYILGNIPDYQKAQRELDEYSHKLQRDIDAVYAEISEMQSSYNAEKVFMTPAMREQREKEIASKENRAQLLQQQYFGSDGVLFAKREELVKPLQDEIVAAIKDVAKEGNYGMIIDVSADNSVVYFDPKLDKSNLVLRKLGYSAKKQDE
ncbi:MAG: OmpH family outer membrane protein [Odoribacter sp.]|nr:OmpH family outer membrane protein [Odoribacter sp.]